VEISTLSWLMIPSQTASLKLLAAAGLLLVADPARELRALRVVPSEDASPTTAVTITFNRPVAGSLDRMDAPVDSSVVNRSVRGVRPPLPRVGSRSALGRGAAAGHPRRSLGLPRGGRVEPGSRRRSASTLGAARPPHTAASGLQGRSRRPGFVRRPRAGRARALGALEVRRLPTGQRPLRLGRHRLSDRAADGPLQHPGPGGRRPSRPLDPAGRKFSIVDTADVRADWVLEAELEPRTGYAVVASPALTTPRGAGACGPAAIASAPSPCPATPPR
jgi:hypothetical protein